MKKLLLILPILSIFFLAGCTNAPLDTPPASPPTKTTTETPAVKKTPEIQPEEVVAKNDSEKEIVVSSNDTTTIIIETSLGDIKVELDAKAAPITVKNFLTYVDAGFYAGTIFHRVIPGFMIQGGGFDTNYKQKPTNKPIKNEATNGLKNDTGTIAMARTSAVDSATSQFFINVKDNDMLNNGTRDFGYAVFGKVISGMNIVTKIENTATEQGLLGGNPSRDVPTEIIEIKKIYRK